MERVEMPFLSNDPYEWAPQRNFPTSFGNRIVIDPTSEDAPLSLSCSVGACMSMFGLSPSVYRKRYSVSMKPCGL